MHSRKIRLLFISAVLMIFFAGGYIWYVFSPSVSDVAFLPDSPLEEGGHWETMAPMNTARSEVSAAVLNGQIYVVGGINGFARTLSSVEVYDPEQDSWSSIPDLPSGVHHTSAVAIEDKIYVIGGYKGIGMVPQDNVYIYDPEEGGWHEGISLPEARGAHGAAVIGDYIYVAGGVTESGLSNDLLRFSVRDETWESLPPMSVARDHLAVGAVGNKLLVAGGRELSLHKNLAVLEVFTVFTDQQPRENGEERPIGEWSRGPDMPTARGGVTGTVIGESLVVSGGEATTNTFSEVEAYEINREAWFLFPDLNNARHGAASAVVDDTLYVIAGGRRPALSVSRINEALTVNLR